MLELAVELVAVDIDIVKAVVGAYALKLAVGLKQGRPVEEAGVGEGVGVFF